MYINMHMSTIPTKRSRVLKSSNDLIIYILAPVCQITQHCKKESFVEKQFTHESVSF